MTLPEDVLRRLGALDADLGRAIVTLVERTAATRVTGGPAGGDRQLRQSCRDRRHAGEGAQAARRGRAGADRKRPRADLARTPPFDPAARARRPRRARARRRHRLERQTLERIADILRQTRSSPRDRARRTHDYRARIEATTAPYPQEEIDDDRRARSCWRSAWRRPARPDLAAQTADSKAYVDLNIAGQTQSVTLATSSAVPLFDELGSTSTSQTVGKGLVFDAGAGYRVRPSLAVGIAFSVSTEPRRARSS